MSQYPDITLIKTLLQKLVSLPSVTPLDAGCQEFMMDYLEKLGFTCQRLNNSPVANFFARFGNQAPLLVFAGHTDVVPVGSEHQWHTPPFELTENEGMVYGRGVADMKGSLAAMMESASRFVKEHPDFSGSLGLLITSGEEGDDFDKGTPYVMSELKKQGITIDYCIVGEPSSTATIADVVKIGRRGSLSLKLQLNGVQGHVAYPHLAKNPIHLISPVLEELTSRNWDEGNAFFPPTSFQVTRIHSGGQASNVIPGELELDANFRFSTEQTSDSLQRDVLACLQRHGLEPQIQWRLNGEPFLTSHGSLLDATVQAIALITHKEPTLSTTGGTSDGRFIAPYGVEVLELGPINATIHQVNESTSLLDLESLSAIYYDVCMRLFDVSSIRDTL